MTDVWVVLVLIWIAENIAGAFPAGYINRPRGHR